MFVSLVLVALARFAGTPLLPRTSAEVSAEPSVDATGGVLPGVTVTVTNTATAVEQNVVTDESGRYRVLYLNPGSYTSPPSSPASRSSSASTTRCGSATSSASTSSSKPAASTETVSVTAERSLLNTSSGISGTTVDSKQIAELPLGDGTAYMLTRLAPGIMDTSDLHFARPGRQRQPRPAS